MPKEKLSGANLLRRTANIIKNCNETFNQRFNAEDWIKLGQAFIDSEYDILPDAWSEEQIKECLTFRATPKWQEVSGELIPMLKDVYIHSHMSKDKFEIGDLVCSNLVPSVNGTILEFGENNTVLLKKSWGEEWNDLCELKIIKKGHSPELARSEPAQIQVLANKVYTLQNALQKESDKVKALTLPERPTVKQWGIFFRWKF